MQKSFDEIVEQITQQDLRYEKEAYDFLKEALEFTIKQKKRSASDPNSHVSATELLDGFRQYALNQFGPMAMTVLQYWHVESSEDVGNLVFNLINAGVFGKTDSDSPEDFHHALDFHLAFEVPFQSAKSNTPRRS